MCMETSVQQPYLRAFLSELHGQLCFRCRSKDISHSQPVRFYNKQAGPRQHTREFCNIGNPEKGSALRPPQRVLSKHFPLRVELFSGEARGEVPKALAANLWLSVANVLRTPQSIPHFALRRAKPP